MSGQQIGSVVGGVVGAVVGSFVPGLGTALGYSLGSAIGGAIGGYVDPTIIKGPRLTDAMQQTVSDGVPLPWGFGTFPTAGNIIWAGDLVERKHEDDGKGSGTVQVTYTYHRSYAILICQGIRQPDGTYEPIAGILQVKRDGKVVYDVSPGVTSEQNAVNAKFLRNHSFVLGSEDQLPSSVVEAELGVGNAPAYPGSVIMYAENVDCTDLRGAISQYEFVISTKGETSTVLGEFAAGRLSAFSNEEWPLPDSEDSYEYTGYRKETALGNYNEFSAATIGEIIQHFADVYGPNRPPEIYLGYSASTGGAPGTDGNVPFGCSLVVEQPDISDNDSLLLIYADMQPAHWLDAEVFDMCPLVPYPGQGGQSEIYADRSGRTFFMVADAQEGQPGYTEFVTCTNYPDTGGTFPQLVGTNPLLIKVTRKRVAPLALPPPGSTQVPDSPEYYITPEGDLVHIPTYTPESGSFRVLNLASPPQNIEGRDQYTYYENGPAVHADDPDFNNQAFWEASYNTALAAGSVPAGWDYGTDYPAVVATVWRETEDGTEIARDKIPLATIVAEACLRSGLTTADFDVSQLTDMVDGYKVAVETSGEAIIAPLMQGFFFDAGEWDDKIWFVKRGGDVLVELTADDLCESDGDVIEETEVQEAELLRKVHVKTIDPAAGYTITTQTAERRTSAVLAKGEQTVEIPVVTDKDTQARIADKKLKVGWAEVRKFKTAIPYTHPELTVTDRIGLTDRKGKRSRIRLMEMSEDSGRIEISEAMLDRQSAYTSNVQGVTHEPPTNTAPGLIGPTFGWVANLPRLRSSEIGPGAYIAACGFLSGWTGCTVLLSVDDQASFQEVATFVQPSSMGILKADATASEEPLEVFMRSGALSSITEDQIALRMNAFAITTNGISELGQFQTATMDSNGIYHLTETIRGALNTTAAAHEEGDPFVMVASSKFLPIDIGLAGKTLYFKFVSFGTSPDDADALPFVFNPLFTGPPTIEPYLDDNGDPYVDDGGFTYFTEE